MPHDTKRTERLLELATEKAALLREECIAGVDYGNELIAERDEIQKYGARLWELQEANARERR